MATLELPEQSTSKATLATNLQEVEAEPAFHADSEAPSRHHDASFSASNNMNAPPRESQPSKRKSNKAVSRYIALSLLAVGLTVASTITSYTTTDHDNDGSPENTIAPSIPSTDQSFSYLSLGAVYVAILAILSRLYQSDPGYLTAETIIQGLNDGAAVDGTLLHNAEIGVGNNQQNTTEDCFVKTTLSSSSPSSSRRRFAAEHIIQEEDEELELKQPLTRSVDASLTNTSSGLSHIGAELASTRRPYCDKCGFSPPLRSHHCKVCDRHVATFDHHCEFIGTCIGEKNHALFWWFLTLQAWGFWVMMNMIGSNRVGWIYLMLSSSSSNEEQSQTQQALFVVAAEFYVYPLAWAAFLMWTIHTFLICTNSTTFEWSKKQHLEYLRGTDLCDLPYSQRCDQNLWSFCWKRSHHFPTLWMPPAPVVRDSEQWWKHPWQNKYWSCC